MVGEMMPFLPRLVIGRVGSGALTPTYALMFLSECRAWASPTEKGRALCGWDVGIPAPRLWDRYTTYPCNYLYEVVSRGLWLRFQFDAPQVCIPGSSCKGGWIVFLEHLEV